MENEKTKSILDNLLTSRKNDKLKKQLLYEDLIKSSSILTNNILDKTPSKTYLIKVDKDKNGGVKEYLEGIKNCSPISEESELPQFKIVDLRPIQPDINFAIMSRINHEHLLRSSMIPLDRFDFEETQKTFEYLLPKLPTLPLPKIKINKMFFEMPNGRKIFRNSFERSYILIYKYKSVRSYLRSQRLFRSLHIHAGIEYFAYDNSVYKVMSIKRNHFNVHKKGGDCVQIIGKNSIFANTLVLEFGDEVRKLSDIEKDIDLFSNKPHTIETSQKLYRLRAELRNYNYLKTVRKCQ